MDWSGDLALWQRRVAEGPEGVARRMAVFAVGQGIAEDDAARWLDQLAEADQEGRFGFVSVPVLTTATAI